MFQVVKRDGEIADFQMGKITAAIHKAFEAKEKHYSEDMIELLGPQIFRGKFRTKKFLWRIFRTVWKTC